MRGYIASFLFMGTTLAAASSLAQTVVIQPGETIYVSSPEYVQCGGGGSPIPPPPPPPRQIRMTVNPNYGCLNGIGRTDGRSIAQAAASCDANNPDRYNTSGMQCQIIDSNVDSATANRIIGGAQTVIYEDQKQTVRDACTRYVYLCQ